MSVRFMAAFAAWIFAATTPAFAQINTDQTLDDVVTLSASSATRAGAHETSSPGPLIELLRTENVGVLSVCNDQRSICKDGKRVFLLGDTAWSARHRLTIDQWRSYLTARREQGFDFIMLVGAMSYRRTDPAMHSNVAGEMPIVGGDFRRVDPAYWADFDRWVKEARQQGLYVGVLPAWGAAYFPDDPSSTRKDRLTKATVYRYCHDVAEKLKDNDNIIWLLGGDHGSTKTITLSDGTKRKLDYRAIIDRCAEGVADGINGVNDGFNEGADWSTSFIAYHTWTWGSTCPNLTQKEWLRFNAVQTGHPKVPPQDYAQVCWNRTPPKPVANLEPWYENLRKVNARWNPDDVVAGPREVRRDAWWSVIGLGTAMHAYGHGDIFQFCHRNSKIKCRFNPDGDWLEAINAGGANDMRHVKAFAESAGQLTPDVTLLAANVSDFEKIVAARGNGLIAAYTYDGTNAIHLRLGSLGATLSGYWYDPRNGTRTPIAPFANPGTMSFTAPDSNDWVLVVEEG